MTEHVNSSSENIPSHTPPLGHRTLTPLYDSAIALLTRETVWRRRLVAAINPQSDDRILDVGSGTGSLAILVHEVSPKTLFEGIDPDSDAVRRARNKAERRGSLAEFRVAYLTADARVGDAVPNKVSSSLVLHQTPVAEKARILETIFQILAPGGELHIADYGLQESLLMRTLFRLTVQSVDGVENTQPNAEGVLPELIRSAGFVEIERYEQVTTLTGMISLYRAAKPRAQYADGAK